MSGGSYDYAYSKIGDVEAFANICEAMATACRRMAIDSITKVDLTTREGVPLTIEEQARVVLAGLRLEAVAKKVRAAHQALVDVEDLMRTVEWIESGDYSVDALLEAKP